MPRAVAVVKTTILGQGIRISGTGYSASGAWVFRGIRGYSRVFGNTHINFGVAGVVFVHMWAWPVSPYIILIRENDISRG